MLPSLTDFPLPFTSPTAITLSCCAGITMNASLPVPCPGLTSPLPVCAGMPPLSARSVGGGTTLLQAAASGQPPAARRAWTERDAADPGAGGALLQGTTLLLLRAGIARRLSPMLTAHRTDPSLHAAIRNVQGMGSCSLLVPHTTERDMYLGKHRTLAACPSWHLLSCRRMGGSSMSSAQDTALSTLGVLRGRTEPKAPQRLRQPSSITSSPGPS